MHSSLLTDLAIVLLVAAPTGLLARRLGQPSVLGYLLAGLVVGPYIPIPLFADPHRMEELAEVGVVLVMLAVGLEFRVRHLLQILPTSGLTALVQISAMGWAGYTAGAVLGWSTAACITLAATLSISSTMVVSSVLRTQPVDPDVRANVFGVLVIQDVVAIALMAVVTALADGLAVSGSSLAWMVAELLGVVVGMLVVGVLVLPRLVRWVVDNLDRGAIVVLVSGAGFAFALAAEALGYSVALGAFLAGMAVAESGRGHEVEEAIDPVKSLFSALFFVSIGMTVDPVVAWSTLPLALLLFAIVVGVQFLSVTLASLLSGSSLRRSVYTGVTLGQIGELSFILATIAIAGGIAPTELLPALVTVATLTAFTTPLLLGRAEGIVFVLDRLLPDRATELLAAYQSFLRRAGDSDDMRSLTRPAVAVALDWCALVLLVVARLTFDPLVAHRDVLANIVFLALVLPFVVGLGRSGISLAQAVKRRLEVSSTPDGIARALVALLVLAVVLATTLPTAALLRPLLPGSWIGGAAALAVVAAVVFVTARVRGIRGEYTSTVARVASSVARHLDDDEEDSVEPRSPLAGLDYTAVGVATTSPSAGRSLAELNLRCRTGATVVAIWRDDDTTVLPTGHEQLRAGDTLALSGSVEAVERARSLLLDPQGMAAP